MDPIDPIVAMDAIGRMDKGGFGGWALVSGFKLVSRGLWFEKMWRNILWVWKKVVPLQSGKSYTASSL